MISFLFCVLTLVNFCKSQYGFVHIKENEHNEVKIKKYFHYRSRNGYSYDFYYPDVNQYDVMYKDGFATAPPPGFPPLDPQFQTAPPTFQVITFPTGPSQLITFPPVNTIPTGPPGTIPTGPPTFPPVQTQPPTFPSEPPTFPTQPPPVQTFPTPPPTFPTAPPTFPTAPPTFPTVPPTFPTPPPTFPTLPPTFPTAPPTFPTFPPLETTTPFFTSPPVQTQSPLFPDNGIGIDPRIMDE